ncbi:MAG TPA: hypothetical protein VNC82_15215 [Candidatus Limnocylindria bacterium]|nr:hypothetical protein [Candidatus Limnocylindria bacterium]
MTSARSGDVAAAVTPRPFYGEFAWAYDYLVERPVAEECAGMADALARRASARARRCWMRAAAPAATRSGSRAAGSR